MSQLRSETARTNGAKSSGPATPEGKAISARNSLRHGLRAKAIVLPDESQEEFFELLEDYLQRFQPADRVESDLVTSMAVTRWRLLRIAAIESGLLAKGIEMAKEYDHDDHLSYAFTTQGGSLANLTRYENSLNRTFDLALKQLQLLQKSRSTPAPGFVRQAPPVMAGDIQVPAPEPATPLNAPVMDTRGQPLPSAP